MPRRLLLLLSAAAVLALGGCGRDDEEPKDGDRPATTATAAGPTATGCRRVEPPRPRSEPDLDRPTTRLSGKQEHTVLLRTTCGDISIRLDARRAPRTAASFASLARRGFYDGLIFHRVVPEFVVQAGDPLGNGQGGPGYNVVEAPPSTLTYTRGTVAMAKTQVEEPGTSGSQFFIVTAEDAGLPAEYALVGKVTGSLEAVDRIAATPTNPSEQPLDPVVIEKATLQSK